ncbi:Septum formation inhibitor MinC [Thiovulum sp. ES]|nr:Septum formation inhibitor MinC [Thiovulum sp. ES]
MKVKQHTLHSFEFHLGDGDEDKFFSFFEKNEAVLKGHTVILNSEIDLEKIREHLNEKDFCFFERTDCKMIERKREVHQVLDFSLEEEKSNNSLSKHKKREIIEKPIRAGSAIQTKNDLTVLSQMNGGSEIETSGNLEMFGSINGKIVCSGSYMLIRDIGETGNVIFNGVILDKDKFKSKKAKIIKLDGEMKLIIEEL